MNRRQDVGRTCSLDRWPRRKQGLRQAAANLSRAEAATAQELSTRKSWLLVKSGHSNSRKRRRIYWETGPAETRASGEWIEFLQRSSRETERTKISSRNFPPGCRGDRTTLITRSSSLVEHGNWAGHHIWRADQQKGYGGRENPWCEVSTGHRKITEGKQELKCKVTKNSWPQIQYKHEVKNIQHRQMQNTFFPLKHTKNSYNHGCHRSSSLIWLEIKNISWFTSTLRMSK
jgi:hypothetical protein